MPDRTYLAKVATRLVDEEVGLIAKTDGRFDANTSVAVREIIEDYPRLVAELHPTCSATDCDWQLNCAHKATYGNNPGQCPFRT